MAMACFRLFTVPPLPPGPDFSVPFFRRRMALATVLLAPALYFFPPRLREDDDFFSVGMRTRLQFVKICAPRLRLSVQHRGELQSNGQEL